MRNESLMVKMRRGTMAGLFLTLLGLTILLVSSIPITSVEEAINTSFTVPSGTKYGPPNGGIGYHTRIFGKSVLKVEVLIEGEGIYLTAYGYNAQHLTNLYEEGLHSLIIDPAHDLYTFTFDNTKGSAESLVKFTLKEVWTRPMAFGSPPLFILGLAGLLLFPVGLVVLAVIRLKTRTTS